MEVDDTPILEGVGVAIKVWYQEFHRWSVVPELVPCQQYISEMRKIENQSASIYKNKLTSPQGRPYHLWLWSPDNYESFSALREQCDQIIMAAMLGYQEEFDPKYIIKFFSAVLKYLLIGLVNKDATDQERVNIVNILCRMIALWQLYCKNIPSIVDTLQSYFQDFRDNPDGRNFKVVKNLHYFASQVFMLNSSGSSKFEEIRQIFIDEFVSREAFTLSKRCSRICFSKNITPASRLQSIFSFCQPNLQLLTLTIHVLSILCTDKLQSCITRTQVSIPSAIMEKIINIAHKVMDMKTMRQFVESLNLPCKSERLANDYWMSFIEVYRRKPTETPPTESQPVPPVVKPIMKVKQQPEVAPVVTKNVFELLQEEDSVVQQEEPKVEVAVDEKKEVYNFLAAAGQFTKSWADYEDDEVEYNE